MSAALDLVRAEINRLARGRRRARFVRVLGAGLFYGYTAGALAALVRIAVVGWAAAGAVGWSWLLGTPLTVCWVVAILSAVVAMIAAWLMPVDTVAVAKRYDDRLGIKDLVSSSLQLEGETSDFARAVREDAAAASGRVGAGELYPMRAPREMSWLPPPLAAALLAVLLPILTAPTPRPPNPAVAPMLVAGADALAALQERWRDQLAELGATPELLQGLKNSAEKLREAEMDKRQSLAELARLASQLDKARKEMQQQKLLVEKNAAKLARGEEFKNVQRDMEAGRYREAANRVREKLKELEKKLKEAVEKKAGKLEIEKLKKQMAQMKNLLAELDQLQAMGRQMGFFAETLEVLERIEGALGELGEFDGLEVEVEIGRMRRGRQPQQMGDQDKLLVSPGNDAGHGHAKAVLGEGKRALTAREEAEVERLRETKGKSQFGQVKTANDGSRSRQAYNEAHLAAQRAAEDAIYRQNIPAGYRRYIRRYFETMQPDERKSSSDDR